MIGALLDIVNKFIPDQTAAKEAAVALEKEVTKQMESQKELIKAEIDQGGIVSKWRPYTMLAFVGMVVVHWFLYDIVPFIRTAFDLNFWVPQDPGFTEGLLPLIQLGLGGYIGGRTIEKAIRIWRK